MLLKNKLEKVKSFIKNDNVLAKLEERYCYSTDASNNRIDSQTPDLVVFVETIEAVQKIVKFANIHEIPIISRGAGTNMVGGCLTPTGGIVLNFSKLNKILDFSAENMTLKVQPGVILENIKNTAESKGLFFPPDPSNYKVSTIGGAIALSSGGALSLKYGTTKDYVLSLKVVTANGEVLTLGSETMKDAAGYHLNQLIIGSEGTLAIVVEATLKLIPKPECRQVISAYFNSFEDAVNAVNKIMTSNISPAAIDFMDKNSITTVEEYDGIKDTLNTQIQKVENILKDYNAYSTSSLKFEDSQKLWEARHSSFAAASRLAPDVISDDIIVPRNNLLNLIDGCYKICDKYNLKICLVGHIGDGNIHPQIVLNLDNESEYRNYQNAKAEIYELTKQLKGNISAEHGIGIEKIAYIESIIDKDTLEYMKIIKRVFDPKNILNPGKIFKL